ncbi:hypothetical protein HD806DRAFT_526413 [Xylariaceae sp. AK1471]|nr:hypothetical protein HD806DRAFT_526413 [Xylariaceae sp. AK1471]
MDLENTAGHPTVREPNAKLARRDLEKRRLQNQKAQKKYRDKRRQRIIDLENLAATIGSGAAAISSSSQDAQGDQSEQNANVNNGYTLTLTNVQTSPDRSQIADQLFQLPPDHINDCLIAHTDSPSGPQIANPSAGNDTASLWELTGWQWDNTNATYDDFSSVAWKIVLVNCGCQIPHIEIRVPSGPGSHCSSRLSHTLAWFNFPDPYANALRLERLCTVEAMRRNCMMLGITDEMWCLADSVSPFFRRNTHDSSANDNLVRSVQGIFQTLKPDLRPCSKQITVGHHPYIDILPFPSVRTNLIKSIGSIDEDEFFHDSLSGLICWGGAGVGRRDRSGVGTGTPWDIRSWEAREWFIQKWWFIVGGEEGELTRQSRWWRALRGEDQESFTVC